jgi:hypothetical protein
LALCFAGLPLVGTREARKARNSVEDVILRGSGNLAMNWFREMMLHSYYYETFADLRQAGPGFFTQIRHYRAVLHILPIGNFEK